MNGRGRRLLGELVQRDVSHGHRRRRDPLHGIGPLLFGIGHLLLIGRGRRHAEIDHFLATGSERRNSDFEEQKLTHKFLIFS